MAGTTVRRRLLRMPMTRLRRYAAVPFLLGMLAAQWKEDHPAPVFRAVAAVEFRAPAAESLLDDKENPQADPRRSLAATAAVVAQGMESPSEAARLHAAGVAGAYDLQPRNSGTTEEPYFSLPRMDITADAGDPASAIRSVSILEATLSSDLVALEDRIQVYPTDRIVTHPLAATSVAPVLGSKSRALFAVTVLGLGSAYLVPKWIESVLLRRAPRVCAAMGRRMPRRRSVPGTAA